jgi:hypothetical protein
MRLAGLTHGIQYLRHRAAKSSQLASSREYNSTMSQPPVEIRPWRDCPFEIGATYRVLKYFVAFDDAFEAGELLVFVRDAYSRYDGMTGYFFRDASGRYRRWDIADDDDLSRWKNIFERTDRLTDT